jgi:hypothetical protein
MGISASEAAKLVGKTKPAIINAIKAGKLSASRDDNGHYVIEPVELFRVYTAVPSVVKSDEELYENLTGDQSEALRAENEQLRQRLADKDDVIDDLRKRLDAATEENTRLSAVLTSQLAPPKLRKAGWWQRLLGGGE